MKRLLTILALGALAGCGYDDFGDYPGRSAEVVFNVDIATLRQSYVAPYTVPDEVVIQGVVTSSDAEGNFYRVFVIDDCSSAIEIRAGLYDLCTTYPVGRRVTVKMKGLTLGMQDGVLQAGFRALPSAYYPVEYIGHRALLEDYVSAGDNVGAPVAADVTIAELNEDMGGRLVRLAKLFSCSAEGSTWAAVSDNPLYPSADGYRKFKDAAGDSVLVATSGYASFASQVMPASLASLTGILYYGKAAGTGGKSMYIIQMRFLSDAVAE